MRALLAVVAIVGTLLVAKGEVRCEKGRVVARDACGKTYLESGEHGLWLVKFAETNRLSAVQVERDAATRSSRNGRRQSWMSR